MKKYDSFINNKKEISKNFPYIQKIAPIRIVFESSPKSFTFVLPKTNYKIMNSKKAQINQRSSINTKLYKINDYLSMTNNFFAKNNFLNQTKNKNRTTDDTNNKNKNNNISDIISDTGKPIVFLHRNQSVGNYNISISNYQNNKPLNLNFHNDRNIQKNTFNKSSNSLIYDSTNDGKTINNCNNNDNIINKINNYNLNLLKKSRYFSKTKYIKGKKKLIKYSQKPTNRSLSTKNISIENTYSNSVHKTNNDIRIENLLNKCKIIDDYNKKNNQNNKQNSEKLAEEKEKLKNNAIFYDYIPIILKHIKQKEKFDDVNRDHEKSWLYHQIKNIYNDNQTEFTKGSKKNKNNILDNPIIRYLFLERTLYNLKHIVNFVDIKNRQELEHKVLKVMGEEYAKLKDKQSIYNVNDFTTIGYELDPKIFVKLKQLKRDEEEYDKKNKNNLDLLMLGKNKNDFFTTNKSVLKNDDNNNDSNYKSISEGTRSFGKMMYSDYRSRYKRRKFGGIKRTDSQNTKSMYNMSQYENSILNKNNQIQKDGNDLENMEDKNKNELNPLLDKSKISLHTLFNQLKASSSSLFNPLKPSSGSLMNPIFNSFNLLNPTLNTLNQLKPTLSTYNQLNPQFENEQLKLAQLFQNEEAAKNSNELLISNKLISNNKTYNISNDNKEILDQKRKSIITGDMANDELSKDKAQRKTNNKTRIIKKKKNKRKKKVNKSKTSENELQEKVPYADFNIINNVTAPPPEQENKEKKEEETKKEVIIRNKFDYERYKEEKKRRKELSRKSKYLLLAALKKEDSKRSNKKKNPVLYELFSSDQNVGHKNDDDESKTNKKFEKIKKIEEKKYVEESEEHSLIYELRQFKEKEKEKEEESDYPSEDVEGLEEIDLSKDIENNGDIVKKRWMENSPKFKNKIIDINSNKRRYAISDDTHKIYDTLFKNEKIKTLNERMRNIYNNIERNKKSYDYKNKRKKKKPFSFEGVDLTSLEEIEKKKKIFLNRLKEDIKYKVKEGKYHLIEIDNFTNFEEAMNKFKLKTTVDIKKVKLYVKLVEKYLHFYKYELDRREKEKMDEDRINKFLRNLNNELYVTLPYVKEVKGRNCHSVDYFKELQELSELHNF